MVCRDGACTVSIVLFTPNGSIQPLAEVLGLLELTQHPVDEVRIGETFVGKVLHHEPVALLEELGLRVVLGIAVGHAFHGMAGVQVKTLGFGDGLHQGLAVEEDLVADGLQGSPLKRISSRMVFSMVVSGMYIPVQSMLWPRYSDSLASMWK